MKKRIAVISALVALAFVAPASAQDGRFNIGLRGSVAAPFGEARGGTNLNDLTTLAVPVQVDVDYRIDENWRAGLYLFYGPATVADEAKAELAALGMTGIGGHRQQRVGLQLTRDFRQNARLSPWVGVAAGYDWTRYAWAKLPSGSETEIGVSGFQATLQLGGSYKVTPRFAIGPFAAVDLGRYGRDLVWTEGGESVATDISEKGLHEWVRFGVKVSYAF